MANDCSLFVMTRNYDVHLLADTINNNKKYKYFLRFVYNANAFNPKYFLGSRHPISFCTIIFPRRLNLSPSHNFKMYSCSFLTGCDKIVVFKQGLQ